MTEFEEFIIALDTAIKNGARAEQALRAYVLNHAKQIRQRDVKATTKPARE